MFKIRTLVVWGWVVVLVADGLIAQPGTDPTSGATTQPAQQPPTTQPSATQPSTQPSTQPTAQQVEQQMLDLLADSPVFVATPQGAVDAGASEVPPSVMSVDVDRRVLGSPPGAEQPKLRREGEFIVNRRGRLIRAPSGGHVLFVFESDAETSPETPMPLLPCQILQSMEDLVQERSDRTRFILSGQVMLYRGVNYLMPTMMKLAIDRGNLQN